MDQYLLWSNENNSAATVNVTTKPDLLDVMEGLPLNSTVADNFVRAWSIINNPNHEKILATISGGADSDVVLDILTKVDYSKKIKYVWINTGLEYQATQDHLDYLEKKYNITFIRIRPKKPIPLAVVQYGQPFLNKNASEHIMRLQRHGFTWIDGSFEELYKLWPDCKSSLEWWCNIHDNSSLNICNNKWLKEFLMSNPPTFRISNKCCYYSKKKPIHDLIVKNKVDLDISGVRKAEGGARRNAYKSCFSAKSCGTYEYDEYRPVWWYKDQDKEDYCDACSVTHSKCYTEYGLPRTGCCGCPFGRDFEHEVEVVRKHEPKLYKAIMTLFSDSYAYTKQYKEFCEMMDNKKKVEKACKKGEYSQLSIFDIFPDIAS